MEYVKQTFVDRAVDAAGNVTQEGTRLRASHLQHMENGIAAAFSAINQLAGGGTGGGGSGWSVLAASGTLEELYIDASGGDYRLWNAGEKYRIDYYAVTAGETYQIRGEGVRLNTAMPIGGFSAALPAINGYLEPVAADDGSDNLHTNTDTARTYNFLYTPATSGYLCIAHTIDWPGLRVCVPASSSGEQGGGQVVIKTPLTLQAFGDSITKHEWDGGSMATWADFIEDYLPEYELTVINSGIGGTCLSIQGDRTDGMAHIFTTEYQDCDVCVVLGGTNDWAGTNKDVTGDLRSMDSSTIHGAVNSIIEAASDEWPNTRLLFVTPIQRYNSKDKSQEAAGVVDESGNPRNAADGCTLEEVADAIRKSCGYYGVPCLDMYHEGGFNRVNIGYLSTDGLHPNEAGARRIAAKIAAKIRTMI